MLSLSDNEFAVISFLVRNFSEKLTIRSMAKRLGFSPAGVFNILKKLEENEIVTGEKLGTGLFYKINLDSRIAHHLACIVLVIDQKPDDYLIQKIKGFKSAILHKKNLLLITDSISSIQLPDYNVDIKTVEEFTDLLRKKDKNSLEIVSEGIVLFGEEVIVLIIKNCIFGF